ncbi:hypothetical protein ACLB2K_011279 [Fragaria x ananassa]
MDDYGASPAGSADESKSTSCPRGHWRPAEDERLRQLVEQYGAQNWNSIAEKLQGRSGKSCRLRWFNQLDPRINRRPFSEEEEERLLAAHRIHGNKWAMIARLFPGRTDNAVKNHWHVIMARRQREQSKLICGSKRSYQDFLISNDSLSNTTSSISNAFDLRILKSSTGFDHNQSSSTTSTVFEFRNPGKGRAMSFMESSRPKSSSCHNWNFASMTSSLSNPNSTSSSGFLRGSEISNYRVSECFKGGNSDHRFVPRINGQYSSPAFVYGRYRGSGSSSSTFGLPNPRRVNVPINHFGCLSSTTSPLGDIHEKHGSNMILKKEYQRAASATTFEDHPHHHHDSSIEHNKEVPFIDFLGVGISS